MAYIQYRPLQRRRQRRLSDGWSVVGPHRQIPYVCTTYIYDKELDTYKYQVDNDYSSKE